MTLIIDRHLIVRLVRLAALLSIMRKRQQCHKVDLDMSDPIDMSIARHVVCLCLFSPFVCPRSIDLVCGVNKRGHHFPSPVPSMFPVVVDSLFTSTPCHYHSSLQLGSLASLSLTFQVEDVGAEQPNMPVSWF